MSKTRAEAQKDNLPPERPQTDPATCAILFARQPVAGQVKTRLLSHLTPPQVAALYAAFLRDCVGALAASAATRRVVAVASPTAGEAGVGRHAVGELRAALGGVLDAATGDVEFEVQVEGDLGARMRAALAAAFAAGAHRAVLLGSDSPSLPADTIDEALVALRGADVVLGPSVDGGYYLVGVTAAAFPTAAPPLFEGGDWGTGRVLAQAVASLPPALRLSLLRPWYDVDRPHEAAFLRDHLLALARSGAATAGHSLAVLRELDLPPAS